MKPKFNVFFTLNYTKNGIRYRKFKEIEMDLSYHADKPSFIFTDCVKIDNSEFRFDYEYTGDFWIKDVHLNGYAGGSFFRNYVHYRSYCVIDKMYLNSDNRNKITAVIVTIDGKEILSDNSIIIEYYDNDPNKGIKSVHIE